MLNCSARMNPPGSDAHLGRGKRAGKHKSRGQRADPTSSSSTPVANSELISITLQQHFGGSILSQQEPAPKPAGAITASRLAHVAARHAAADAGLLLAAIPGRGLWVRLRSQSFAQEHLR
jgi:hypothetical protein